MNGKPCLTKLPLCPLGGALASLPDELEARFARLCSMHLGTMGEWDLEPQVTRQPQSPRRAKCRRLSYELVNLEGNSPWLCHLILAQAVAGTLFSIGHFDTMGVHKWKFPGKRKGCRAISLAVGVGLAGCYAAWARLPALGSK